MAGLVPTIHVFASSARKSWMPPQSRMFPTWGNHELPKSGTPDFGYERGHDDSRVGQEESVDQPASFRSLCDRVNHLLRKTARQAICQLYIVTVASDGGNDAQPPRTTRQRNGNDIGSTPGTFQERPRMREPNRATQAHARDRSTCTRCAPSLSHPSTHLSATTTRRDDGGARSREAARPGAGRMRHP